MFERSWIRTCVMWGSFDSAFDHHAVGECMGGCTGGCTGGWMWVGERTSWEMTPRTRWGRPSIISSTPMFTT